MAALAATTALLAVPASAEPEAWGDGWTVERVGEAYEVTVELDGPLEIRAAAPAVMVDGEEVGVAVVSEDGATLTTVTDDPAVLQAADIEAGWSGEGGLTTDAARASVVRDPDAATQARPFAEVDPDRMTYDIATLDYDLGPQVPLRGIPGRMGELAAQVTYPVNAAGRRPVVMIAHGRGPICTTADSGVAVETQSYPCALDEAEVAAQTGFASLATDLAEDGYVVVAMRTNAVAAWDASVPDRGAAARAGQILAHLDLLARVEAGTAEGGAPVVLRGKVDLSDIGLLGHSRGGEAVVRATQLAAIEGRSGIRSVMLLAPTDMGRLTLPDVPTYTMLPYCDGDLVTLQGQHYYEDSRYAFDDDVLRATSLVMGANHNYFNSALPGGELPDPIRDDLPLPWVGDDWDRQIAAKAPVDPACSRDGDGDGDVVGSERLTAQEQVDVRDRFASAWFRLTLGAEAGLLDLFDGSDHVPQELLASGVEVTTVATMPRSARVDLAPMTAASSAVAPIGGATARICASLPGTPAAASLPACADVPPSRAPHWAPTLNVLSTPAGRMLDLRWTSTGGGIRIRLPQPVDARAYEALSFRAALAPDSTSVPRMRVIVSDTAGNEAVLADASLDAALQPLPGRAAPMAKTLLRTVRLPVDLPPGSAVDLSRIAEVRLEGTSSTGAVLVSDVALSTPDVGGPNGQALPQLRLQELEVREGNGPGIALVPVRLASPAPVPVTASVETVTERGPDAQPAVRTVTFEPGQTCAVLAVALVGDRLESPAARRAVVVSAAEVEGAVGAVPWTLLTVLEDDGAPATRTRPAIPPLPPETAIRTDPCGRTSGELFRDVPTGMLFHESMAWLAVTGVTTGWSTPSGPEYRPLTPVARDAMAAFLYRFAGSPAYTPPSTSPFVDVATTNVYYKEIAWLRERGISTGWETAAGREFRPYEAVARDAMAAFLYRFAGSPTFQAPTASPFADVLTDQQHFKEMAWVSSAGVSTGWEENGRREYRASLPVARDAMAAFLERLTRIP
ncbi:hypothetical protein SERN_1338 [Serinibacter arcticus]|uniref:SLH domain-containing protein n=1 Tax=Serinibacter arcticus TaxID=1655435 RepID=A0A4Z1E0E0_9MICO|nr:hypothetical protein SERN_1338 [Serinibacter arcticus]